MPFQPWIPGGPKLGLLAPMDSNLLKRSHPLKPLKYKFPDGGDDGEYDPTLVEYVGRPYEEKCNSGNGYRCKEGHPAVNALGISNKPFLCWFQRLF